MGLSNKVVIMAVLIATILSFIIPPTFAMAGVTLSVDSKMYIGQPIAVLLPAQWSKVTFSYAYHALPSDPTDGTTPPTWQFLTQTIPVLSSTERPSRSKLFLNSTEHYDLTNALYTANRDEDSSGSARRGVLPGYPAVLSVPILLTVSILPPATGDGSTSTAEVYNFELNLISRCDYLLHFDDAKLSCPSVASCNPSTTKTELDLGINPIQGHCECNPTYVVDGDHLTFARGDYHFGPACSSPTTPLFKNTTSSGTLFPLQDINSSVLNVQRSQRISFPPLPPKSAPFFENLGFAGSNMLAKLIYEPFGPKFDPATIGPIPLEFDSASIPHFVIPDVYSFHEDVKLGNVTVTPVVASAQIRFYQLINNRETLVGTTNLLPLQFSRAPVYKMIADKPSSPIGSCMTADGPSACKIDLCSKWSATFGDLDSSTSVLPLTLTRHYTNNLPLSPLFPSSVGFGLLISSKQYQYFIPVDIEPAYPLTWDPDTRSFPDANGNLNEMKLAYTHITLDEFQIPSGDWIISLLFGEGNTDELNYCAFHTPVTVGAVTQTHNFDSTSIDIDSYEFEHRIRFDNIENFAGSSRLDIPPLMLLPLEAQTLHPVPLWPKNRELTKKLNKQYNPVQLYAPYALTPDASVPIQIYSMSTYSLDKNVQTWSSDRNVAATANSCEQLELDLGRSTSLSPYTLFAPWHFSVNNIGSTQLNSIQFSTSENPTAEELVRAKNWQSDQDEFTIVLDPSALKLVPSVVFASEAYVTVWAHFDRGDPQNPCKTSFGFYLELADWPNPLSLSLVSITQSTLTVKLSHFVDISDGTVSVWIGETLSQPTLLSGDVPGETTYTFGITASPDSTYQLKIALDMPGYNTLETSGSFIYEAITSTQLENPTPRQIQLKWTLPTSRLTALEAATSPPATNYYKFTIHPSQPWPASYADRYLTSQGLLRGQAVFGIVDSPNPPQVDPGDPLNTIAFPETAKSVILSLPSFPTGEGEAFLSPYNFVILMSLVNPITDDAFPDTHHAVWKYDSGNLNPCPTVTCTGTDLCNSYTGLCQADSQPVAWSLSPLIVDKKCQLKDRCPLHFEPNLECTQCICASTECAENTRSVQIKFKPVVFSGQVSEAYNKKRWIVVENYIRDQLQLGLANLCTYSRNSAYFPTSATVGPNPCKIHITGRPEVDAIGFETMHVNYMNPTILTGADFSTVLVTFSMKPYLAADTSTGDQAKRKNRFDALVGRLQQYIQSNSNADQTWLAESSHPFLPFAINFATIPPTSTLSSFNLRQKLLPKSPPLTRCSYTSNANVVLYDTCPTPTTTMLALSPFWKACPATTGPAAASPSRTLEPHCYDYAGDTVDPAPQWCTDGWFNYPRIRSVPCTTGTSINAAPNPLTWAASVSFPFASPAGAMITLRWDWDTTLYSSQYTVEVLIVKEIGGYSTLLGTTLGANQLITVQLPLWDANAPNATIRLRCVNSAKSVSPALSVPVQGAALCQNVTCGAGQECNKSNGECQCLPGHYQPSVGSRLSGCLPQCFGKCSSPGFCTAEQPLSCGGQCPVNKTGALCDIAITCENNAAGTNPQCANRGFLTFPDDQLNCASGTCQCNGFWDNSSKCAQCLLTDSVDLAQRCVITQSNYTSTKSNLPDIGLDCKQCQCLPGFFGSLCQYGAIRANITFEKAATEPSPFQLASTTDDINGMHFITEEGRDVLVRDVAASLGIDPQYVTITHISQTTTTPSPMVILAIPTIQTTVLYSVSPMGTGGMNENSGNGLSSLNDLTSTWTQMQQGFTDLPIGVTEASDQIGNPISVGSPQQPESALDCPTGQTCDCAVEERLTNGGACPFKEPVDPNASRSKLGMIIGIAVGAVVGVALIFIVAVLLVRHGKKHEKWCFARPEKRTSKRSQSGSNTMELGETSATVTTSSVVASSSKTSTTGSRTAVDLEEIKDHGESLPDGWSKQKHLVTGDQFYVFIKNGEMKSQKSSPVGDNDVEDKGW